MTKQSAKTAVPRLRFPGFRKSWDSIAVSDFFDLAAKAEKTSFFDGDRLLTVKLHCNGVVKNERSTLTGGANYFTRKAGQFIFSKIDLLNGAFGIVPDALDGFSSSSDVPAYSFNAECSSIFFLNWLKSHYSRIQIERTGTSNTLKRVAPEKFLALAILAPSLAEQQKIADCLTSLDEVIAAQGRQVEALKAHKRGLMQQLFPREGETRPRLRFPEFREAPEWRVEPVSALIYTVTPPRKIATSGYQPDGRLAIVDQSPDAICGWTDDLNAKVDAALPLIVFGDHTCVLKLIEYDFAQGADGIKIISAKPCVDIRFLFFGLQIDPIASISYRRHFSLLQEKRIAFPQEPAEQQRIADCLSSLDAQITAETNQLVALKTHKQGLMQQLFPAPEAEAT